MEFQLSTLLKILLPFIRLRKHPIETDRKLILQLLKDRTQTIEEIENEIPSVSKNRIREAIYRLIYDGAIESINLNTVPLGKKTELKCNG